MQEIVVFGNNVQLYIRIHRDCDYIQKSCASTSQKKSQHTGRKVRMKAHPHQQLRIYWHLMVCGRGRLHFSSMMSPLHRSTRYQMWRPTEKTSCATQTRLMRAAEKWKTQSWGGREERVESVVMWGAERRRNYVQTNEFQVSQGYAGRH